MNKALTDDEMSEVRGMLTNKNRVAMYVAIISGVAAIISSIGTAVASVIIALKSEGK